MKELTKYSMEYKLLQIFMFLASLLLSLTVIFQNIYLGKIINQMLVVKSGYEQLYLWLGILLAVLLLRACFNYLNQLSGQQLSFKVKRDVRHNLINKDTERSKVTILTEVVEGIHPFYESYLPQVFKSTIIPIAIIITLFFIHWPAALIMMITAPFIPLFYIVFGLRTRDKAKDQMQSLDRFASEFIDLTKGLVSLKLFNRTDETTAKIHKSSTSFRDLTMEILKSAFLSGLMLEFISMLGIGIVALEVGLRLIVFNDVSFVVAIITLLLAPEFYNAIKDLGQAFHTGKQSEGYIEMIEEMNNEEQAKKTAIQIDSNMNQQDMIQFNDVSFAYPNRQDFSFNKINLNIKEKSHTAIIGPSGAGKSTLIQLMLNELSPNNGEIKYKKSLKIGYLSQRPYIFSATLLENVTMFQNYDENHVFDVLKEVGLMEKVTQLSKGINTMIGDGYEMLSGGEMRRVELARLLLLNPDVVIFDEPTTGLDIKTEQLIVHTVNQFANEKTVITIAHRKEVLKYATHYIEIQNGEVREIDVPHKGGVMQ
ncbi:ABC transporter ATP-binding protein/permease [Mammaliicoccus vitulinus]|uniref:ATP-binding cassette domain-containing protein n=3 Tax=Mammaliicoccus vitulinus TaxID=71237 RepID=A0ABX7HG10_9STAP|nr:ATP-binding cassette domain-containing protein [Mammaliicoccus vitulinus]MBO3076289.1 ATP-binding cassette domain-containing protein [Mammaliicoccus vitulinus]PNZ39903.1 cysteine ABC transporter ATP-binding protein [Mammaliicoccus vitulinus]QQT15505.1 ATP-binding cassette domain-containing protein [Mammaliicoccus vitulinus]QQY19193.1 ATP-binding cassette domain-containing protein [Mammaliicoccus vitulinus]QRO85552.1 ATP-binding cassette domain-containing protein [Mammaliicoccus vitulinus]